MWLKRKTSKKNDTGFKIKFPGKDGAPFSMQAMGECLYEASRRLQQYQDGYRIKRATLYLTVVDANGDEVLLNREAEWIIRPYASAADEFGA
ncbi:MAG: hypothetical protein AB7T86_05030 [Xanthobacteraceae bacterium]